MTPDLSKGDMLHRLAIPLRSDTIKIPDFVATFGEKVRVDEIPSDKWREYSKNKYEAVKKRFDRLLSGFLLVKQYEFIFSTPVLKLNITVRRTVNLNMQISIFNSHLMEYIFYRLKVMAMR